MTLFPVNKYVITNLHTDPPGGVVFYSSYSWSKNNPQLFDSYDEALRALAYIEVSQPQYIKSCSICEVTVKEIKNDNN